ncbi:hypothetical protein L916_03221, partial [Phytophthora nicotianae]
MKRLFRSFPEVVLVDATHDTNANRYKLFSFAVHDVFGKGQYVFHSLIETEEIPNLRMAVESFKKYNPSWKDIRVVMTDKAMHEKTVLRESIPQAPQLLCQWHVITWLKKQAVRLAPKNKDKLKGLVKALVYSRNSQEYEANKTAILQSLGGGGGDKEHPMYKFLMDNWDNSQDEWVSYRRGNVVHLDNNTNNRLESKWGKIKQVLEKHFTLDDTISTPIMIQGIAEDEYVSQYHEVGSRPVRKGVTEELRSFGRYISEYAFGLLANQYATAVGSTADYEIDLRAPGKAALTRPGTDTTYMIDTSASVCDCDFMQTRLLPCRHVMYFRFKHNYESVIPPLQTFPLRWMVRAPENNIDAGDVGAGGLVKIICDAVREGTPVATRDKYIQSKALAEKIVDRMSLQSTPTYRVALDWMQGFYNALQSGELPAFVVRTDLPQTSSPDSTDRTQITLTGPSAPTYIASAADEEGVNLEEKQPVPVQDGSDGKEEVQEVPGQATTRPTEADSLQPAPSATASSAATGDVPERTKRTPDVSPQGTETDPISFAEPPRVRGLSNREKRRLSGRKELREARELALRINDGKKTRKTRLDDVAALLEGAYSMDTAKAMVDSLVLDDVEVQGSASIRPYNVGQRVPKIRAIPQLDKIREAIAAIKAKDNVKLLANWPEYGFATFDQLEAMASVLEARNQFQLVYFTLEWIEGVEWQAKDVVPPFTDTCDHTKLAYKEAVTGMVLGEIRLGPEWCMGCSLLDFCENLWLHSSSITSAMLALQQMYPKVGVINPSYYDLVGLSTKKKTAGGFGAMDPNNERIIAVICIDHHWGAYLLDKRKNVCYTFDPLQLKKNLATLKSSMQF